MPGQKEVACIDLSGTLLDHHEMDRPVALMPQVLNAMLREGWRVLVLTRYTERYADDRLKDAGVETNFEVVQVPGKQSFVEKLLEDPEVEKLLYVDDNPVSIADISAIEDERVRVLGFVGSAKYCPQLPNECMQGGTSLALSAPDLAEALAVPLTPELGKLSLSPQSLASLLPGLPDPLGGEPLPASGFDQTAPLALLRGSTPDWWRFARRKLGWLTAADGLWCAVVEAAVAATDVDRAALLTGAETAQEYADSLTGASPDLKRPLEAGFAETIEDVVLGVAELGAEAEICRPAGREMEPGRLENVFARLQETFGETAWLGAAQRQLEESRTRTISG